MDYEGNIGAAAAETSMTLRQPFFTPDIFSACRTMLSNRMYHTVAVGSCDCFCPFVRLSLMIPA